MTAFITLLVLHNTLLNKSSKYLKYERHTYPICMDHYGYYTYKLYIGYLHDCVQLCMFVSETFDTTCFIKFVFLPQQVLSGKSSTSFRRGSADRQMKGSPR